MVHGQRYTVSETFSVYWKDYPNFNLEVPVTNRYILSFIMPQISKIISRETNQYAHQFLQICLT
jgi:hypothetical protein